MRVKFFTRRSVRKNIKELVVASFVLALLYFFIMFMFKLFPPPTV